jgi:hypothetical protein
LRLRIVLICGDCRACDCDGHVSLRLEFGAVNRLRIQVKSRAHFGVAEKLLNCLYVLPPAD